MTDATDTASNPTTSNTAETGTNIGIQAHEVHHSTVYMVSPNDPPSQKYAVGVSFLEDGVPLRARQLIDEAIAHRYDNSEVRFHWALAMLSKRSFRDLTLSERDQLDHAQGIVYQYADDEWKQSLRVIFALLACQVDPGSDADLAFKELSTLPNAHRDKIIRHLDLILTGNTKDKLWSETRHNAEIARFSHKRLDRVWTYFQPKPIPPRVRKPASAQIDFANFVIAIGGSIISVVAFGYLGWLLSDYSVLLPVFAGLTILPAGYIAARVGHKWHYRRRRLRAKDLENFRYAKRARAPESGFANQVDHSFDYYSHKYVPDGIPRVRWLAETSGIRSALRDEIVGLYRESRINVNRINWLIRYLVRDVHDRWLAGTLLEYREKYQTALTTKLRCVLALGAIAVAMSSLLVFTMNAGLLSGVAAWITVLVSGFIAAQQWLLIYSERRRATEDYQESERISQERQIAYKNWRAKLESKLPSENEMEKWLTCDKTALLDEAMRHYRLAWRDVIAYAFLQTPVKGCKKARRSYGPLRYSAYDIRLFLITQEGVREISATLNFERGTINSQKRDNFGFEKVSSVTVTKSGDFSYTLKLTLVDGQSREIDITETGIEESYFDEDRETIAEINLDNAGFAHALHILEGIAADGKKWIGNSNWVSTNMR